MVAPGPDGRQRHLSTVWDLAVEAQGVQADLRISFPCRIVIRGGSNLPHGQEPVGMFAHRLVSGHWRVQTGVAGIGEEGTVTTAGIVGLSVVTGWDKRRPEWVDVAWLAMRVRVGRQRKGGVDVIDVEGEEKAPPAPPARKRKAQPPPPQGDTDAAPPPHGPAYGQPRGAGGTGPAEGGCGGMGAPPPPPSPQGSGDGRRFLRGGGTELLGLRWPQLCSTGGGGVALPLTLGPPVPSNLHGCYLYIFIYEYMYMEVLPALPPQAWAV